jgi:hypothetical protein
LEQPVDGFEEAVGLSRFDPGRACLKFCVRGI